ncbi:MAG TPA: hypothetical protein VK550_00210 [Polyangiaceae bacterium]|nr:hypothetical protein [Polyangiaceae bacterium]
MGQYAARVEATANEHGDSTRRPDRSFDGALKYGAKLARKVIGRAEVREDLDDGVVLLDDASRINQHGLSSFDATDLVEHGGRRVRRTSGQEQCRKRIPIGRSAVQTRCERLKARARGNGAAWQSHEVQTATRRETAAQDETFRRACNHRVLTAKTPRVR